MSKRRRPSLLGALLWIGLGALFLLRNFGIGPDFWSLAGRYWPVLLILLGVGKIIDYSLKKDSVSIRFGEIVGILLLLMIGSALTKISYSHFSRIVRELPIPIGGESITPGQWIGETHTFTEESTYSAENPLPILIENSYGSVSITPGSDRAIRVILKKVIYGSESRSKAIADEIRLEAKSERRGSAAESLKPEAEPGKYTDAEYFVIRTNREALSSKNYMFNSNLEIIAPKNSQLQVKNTFGEIRVSEMNGDLDLSTTHKEVDVRNCAGQFKISVRYAGSHLENLNGNVNLDAQGRVYIDNIKGDVFVTNERAALEIFNVDGTVQATNTEGNIQIEKITKHATIISRGARVNVDNLQGGLKINASHGNVDISNVSSDVVVESRYASLSLEEIRGNVDIRSNSDRVSADDIRGSFKLKGYGSGVTVNGITAALDIQTTLKDVIVNDYADSCTITNEYSRIRISTGVLGKGYVNLKNRNGDIELFLP